MKKRYWLRGGVALVSVGLLWGIVLPVLFTRPSTMSLLESLLFPPTLLALVILFGFGALLGWCYGKFKNRNAIQSVIPTEE